MPKYRCPDNLQPGNEVENEIFGCGAVFDAEPDFEGLVDCDECGIWFTPALEPHTILEAHGGRPDSPTGE